ncbi:MAG TPA: polysaccharide biosynthesis/export family protein [Tepidisphaeraceae bacterium]|jgi:hypothetical protein|nr:polysaccharide biosynthesis/export family protein [Tepidisphaeraceae bacterium]
MRRLFTLASVLSLMLCIGAGAIWARSHRATDALYRESREYTPASRRVEDSLTSDIGGLRIGHIVWSYNANAAPDGWSPKSETSIRIRPGDNVRITLFNLMTVGQETSRISRVNQGGDVMLPYLNGIRAQGRTPAQFAEAIRDEYDEANLIQTVRQATRLIDANGSERAIVAAAAKPAAGVSWTLARVSSSPSSPPSITGAFGGTAPLSSLRLPRWHLLGFQFDADNIPAYTHTRREWSFIAPDWALCLLFAVFPTLSFLRLLRRRRWMKTDRCSNCGYDLRATPLRCPECGKETGLQKRKIAATPAAR